MSAVVINEGIVHYEAFGRGSPPILFLHGWLGSWRYWMPTMESLAVDYRVYALDLWGFGDSDKSTERFTIDHFTLLIENFIQELGLEEPIIVGHALGAVVAVEYAAKNGTVVNKIMAVSLPLSSRVIDRRLMNYTQTSVLAKVFRWRPIPNREIEEEAGRAAEQVIPLSLQSFAEYDSLARLLKVNCNVLLVFGEKDDVIDPTPLRDLENKLSHIRHISLSESKHFPMVDEGAKFNRLLRDFADKEATLETLTLKEEWRRRTR